MYTKKIKILCKQLRYSLDVIRLIEENSRSCKSVKKKCQQTLPICNCRQQRRNVIVWLQHGRVVLGLSRNLLGPPILSFLLAYRSVEHSFYASIIAGQTKSYYSSCRARVTRELFSSLWKKTLFLLPNSAQVPSRDLYALVKYTLPFQCRFFENIPSFLTYCLWVQ